MEEIKIVNNYIKNLQSSIDGLLEQTISFEKACSLIVHANSVNCIGVGKSGYLAHKLSASLRSISLRSDFISAAEALHGDLGRISEGEIVIIISKSGESDEIKSILPYLKKYKIKIIALTNRSDSSLAKQAEIILKLNVSHEGDKDNLLPLISTDISLITCNIIVSICVSKINITPEKFQEGHPGGLLGFLAGKTLIDIESWKVRKPFVSPDSNLQDALLVMSEYRTGLVCVVDKNLLLRGIITDGDVRKNLTGKLNFAAIKVKEWMNQKPQTVEDQSSLVDALNVFESSGNILSLPVINSSSKCIGVLTIHDIVK